MAGKGDPVLLVRYQLAPETDRDTFIEMFSDIAGWGLEEGWVKGLHLLGQDDDPRRMDAISFWSNDVDWRKAYEEDRMREWVAESERLCSRIERVPSSYLVSAAGLLG